jgi:hypothetical protein
MSGKRISEDLAAIEAALASLNPTACGVDRDRMMYLAGRAAAGRSSAAAGHASASWLWPCATAAMALLVHTVATVSAGIALAALTLGTVSLVWGQREGPGRTDRLETDRPIDAQESSRAPCVRRDDNLEAALGQKTLPRNWLEVRVPLRPRAVHMSRAPQWKGALETQIAKQAHRRREMTGLVGGWPG